MFSIQKVSDRTKAQRICRSFGLDHAGGTAYTVTENDRILASAAFMLEEGGHMVVWGIDTGRSFDGKLADGILRAAFSNARHTGAKSAALGDSLTQEQRRTLDKLGYTYPQAMDLERFFQKKPCGGK